MGQLSTRKRLAKLGLDWAWLVKQLPSPPFLKGEECERRHAELQAQYDVSPKALREIKRRLARDAKKKAKVTHDTP